MKILSAWVREYLPPLAATDAELAEALTLRGIAVEGIFDLGRERGHLFEMDITTNRVDAMNHYGIAREAAAIYDVPLHPLDVTLPAAAPGRGTFPVRIEAPLHCGRFTAQIVRGVQVAPSSGKVAERFTLLDQKQIWNAVDATNYAWLAMGHPTHAFDLDKVTGGIVVRCAHKGEKLKLLDGTERTLEPDDCVVADEEKALGLAGVMGGWDSMITPETKNVLIEAAWFDPAAVRRSARRHGLHTDASHRFERGADFNGPPVANALVGQLMLASGGKLDGPLMDVATPQARQRTVERPPVELRMSEVARILGQTLDGRGISSADVRQILQALGCSMTAESEGRYRVKLPSWRLDLEREVDLLEEIARVYGYNRFANTLPSFSGSVVELPEAAKEDAVRRTLLAAGLNEAVSITFTSATDAVTFSPRPNWIVGLENAISEEASMMRPSLLPGMLAMLEHNLNRGVSDVRLFEMGTVFGGSAERVEEHAAVAVGLTGMFADASVHGTGRTATFYDLKGVVEQVVSRFSARSVYYDALLLPVWLHPGCGARVAVNGQTAGHLGQLHPDLAQARKLRQPVYIAELYLNRLFENALRQPAALDPPRFPAVERDFSFFFADEVRWEQVREAIESAGVPELVRIEPVEIFRDAAAVKAPAGSYSLLVRCVLQSAERTLREEEVQSAMAAIESALTRLGGRQRK